MTLDYGACELSPPKVFRSRQPCSRPFTSVSNMKLTGPRPTFSCCKPLESLVSMHCVRACCVRLLCFTEEFEAVVHLYDVGILVTTYPPCLMHKL